MVKSSKKNWTKTNYTFVKGRPSEEFPQHVELPEDEAWARAKRILKIYPMDEDMPPPPKRYRMGNSYVRDLLKEIEDVERTED